ncbi:MAG: transglycosylase domain-containing protein [Alphaproteobacteria bacterium]|nr:transglycosylase domain-containing protein [Alphaproteobacteria bacterium]
MKGTKEAEEKKPMPWVLRATAIALTGALAVIAAIATYILFVFLQMPPLDSMLRETRAPAITFIDTDGYEIRSYNKIMGTPVSAETLPPHVWQAIIAIEDKRFFEHGAIDVRGISRAMLANFKAGHIASGGSSLTQQAAKNIFLSPKRTVSRKVQEVILSYWLENKFTKNQILDLYMNRISLVRGMRGIDAAARDLFQKTANELTLAESAQIAAMLKAPTAYSPVKNPERNIARAKIILKEMVRQKFITLDEARTAATQLYALTPPPDTNVFRYWTDYIADEVASRLGDEIDSDLLVYTTLDSGLQERAAAVLRRHVADAYDKNVGQGALVAMSHDGALRAMVGGTDYQDSQFNRAIALRQPGSAFKPVVYLVALEHGMMPGDIVNDSRFVIGNYKPKNYNEKYYGDITLATAFAKSVNSVPLKLTEKFGISEVLKMARRLGVGANLKREYSTVLGACEMSLLDLTTMNAVIWNEGYSLKPYAIEKIVTPKGKVLYERNSTEPEPLLHLETVTNMQILLGDVLKMGGTGTRAKAPGVLGGKTGTSNDNRDAWFVGATDDDVSVAEMVVGVWVGNDDNSPMDSKITGGTVPAEIFRDVVK